MKTLTKRLLAIILSAVMVFSLVPAISATDTEVNDEVQADGETITVNAATDTSGDYTYLPITVRDFATDGILFGYNPTKYSTVETVFYTDEMEADPSGYLTYQTNDTSWDDAATIYDQNGFVAYNLPLTNFNGTVMTTGTGSTTNRFFTENISNAGFDANEDAFKFTAMANNNCQLKWNSMHIRHIGYNVSHLYITYKLDKDMTKGNAFFSTFKDFDYGANLYGNGGGNIRIPSTGGEYKTYLIPISTLIDGLDSVKSLGACSFTLEMNGIQGTTFYIKSMGFLWSNTAMDANAGLTLENGEGVAGWSAYHCSYTSSYAGKGAGFLTDDAYPYFRIKTTGDDPYFQLDFKGFYGRTDAEGVYERTEYIWLRYRTSNVKGIQTFWRFDGNCASGVKYLVTDGQWHDIIYKVDCASTSNAWGNSRLDIIPETSGVTIDIAACMLLTETMVRQVSAYSGSVNMGNLLYNGDKYVVHTSYADASDGSYRALTATNKDDHVTDYLFYDSNSTKYGLQDINKYRYLRFEYKTNRGTFTIKYTTSASTSGTFNVSPTSDGKWHTALVDMGSVANWKGTLRTLALSSSTYCSQGEYLAVKAVGLFENYDEAYYYNPKPTDNSAFASSLTSPSLSNGKLVFPESTVTTFMKNLKTALTLPEYTSEPMTYYNYNWLNTPLANTLKSQITSDGTYAASAAKDLSAVSKITTYYDAAYFLLNNLFTDATGYRVLTENLPYMSLQNNGSDTYTFNSSAYVKENGVGLYNGTTATSRFSPITTSTTDYDTTNNRYIYSSNYVNDGYDYDYTIEGHGIFRYTSGLTFTISGDDDMFVFINGSRVLSAAGTVNLDTLGLTEGQIYDFDLFYLQRSGKTSALNISTNIEFLHNIADTSLTVSYDAAGTSVLSDYDVLNPERDYYVTATITNISDEPLLKLQNASIVEPKFGLNYTSTALDGGDTEIVSIYVNGVAADETAAKNALALLEPGQTVKIVSKYSTGKITANEKVSAACTGKGTLILDDLTSYVADDIDESVFNKIPVIDIFVKVGTTKAATDDFFFVGETLVGNSTYSNGAYTAAGCTSTKSTSGSLAIYAADGGLACTVDAEGNSTAYATLSDTNGNTYGPYQFNINAYTADVADKAVVDYSLGFTLPAASGLGQFNVGMRNDTSVAYDISTGAGISATKNDDNSVDFEISSFMTGINTFNADIYVLANGYTGTTPKLTEGVVLNYALTIVPANVMYYEENFGGITYSGDVVSGTLDGAEELKQTISGGAYGYDDAYASNQNTSNVEGNSGKLHWGGRLDFEYGTISGNGGFDGFGNNYNFSAGSYAGIDTTKPGYNSRNHFAEFTFTGEGFEILSTTNFSSAMLRIDVYKGSEKVTTRIVATAYTNGEIHQAPVVRVNNLARDTYTVKIFASIPMTTNAAYAGMSTCFYLDGIRVYNSLSDTDAATYYDKGEAGAEFIYIRDMLTTATSTGSANTAAMATVTFDKNYKATYSIGTGAALVEHIGADAPGAAGEWVSPGGSLPTDYKYSQVGPKSETYIEVGTAVAFKLSPEADVAENGLFQISVRKFGDKTATFGYVLADGTVETVAVVDTYSSMFYNIDLANCPKDSDGDYIVVVGPVDTGDGNNGMLSLGMVKVNGYTVEGIELTDAATTDVTNTALVIEEGLVALAGVEYAYNNEVVINSVATPAAVELGDTITMKVIASANATSARVLDAEGNDVDIISQSVEVYGEYAMITIEIVAETAGEFNYQITVSDAEYRMSPAFSTETITVIE